MVTIMKNYLFKIKDIAARLGDSQKNEAELKLLDELIEVAEIYKKALVNASLQTTKASVVDPKALGLKIEKISETTFLYKPVTTKNYYEGDYLERFSEIRTSNLQSCGAFDLHNKFWQAHEVLGGNVFATIPTELITDPQETKLDHLGWYKANVDIHEINVDEGNQLPIYKVNNNISKLFEHYLLVREVYGNILMVLHYKI